MTMLSNLNIESKINIVKIDMKIKLLRQKAINSIKN